MLTAPSEWVHRRVEHVRFNAGDRMRYDFSIDFSVPERAPRVVLPRGQEVRIVPLATLPARQQGPTRLSGWLLNFDLRDEAGAAVSMLSSREAVLLSTAAVAAFAMGALRAGSRAWRLEPLVSEWLRAHVVQAYGRPTESGAGPGTDAFGEGDRARPIKDIEGDLEQTDGLSARQRRARKVAKDQVDALTAHPFVMGLLGDLKASVVLYVALTDPPGTRRVLKFSYDRPVNIEFKRRGPDREAGSGDSRPSEESERTSGSGGLRSRFGLSPMLMVDDAPGTAQAWSYHHLVDPPPGVRVIRAELQRYSRKGEKWEVLDRDAPEVERMSHLNSSGWLLNRRYRIVLQLGIDADVWLQQLAVATTVVALLMAMFVAHTWGPEEAPPVLLPVATLDPEPTIGKEVPRVVPVDLSVVPVEQNQEGTTAVLLTLTAAAYGLVTRAGEHNLAARLVWGIRLTAWIMAVLPVLIAGALVFSPAILENRLLLAGLLLLCGMGAVHLWVARARAVRPQRGRESAMIETLHDVPVEGS